MNVWLFASIVIFSLIPFMYLTKLMYSSEKKIRLAGQSFFLGLTGCGCLVRYFFSPEWQNYWQNSAHLFRKTISDISIGLSWILFFVAIAVVYYVVYRIIFD